MAVDGAQALGLTISTRFSLSVSSELHIFFWVFHSEILFKVILEWCVGCVVQGKCGCRHFCCRCVGALEWPREDPPLDEVDWQCHGMYSLSSLLCILSNKKLCDFVWISWMSSCVTGLWKWILKWRGNYAWAGVEAEAGFLKMDTPVPCFWSRLWVFVVGSEHGGNCTSYPVLLTIPATHVISLRIYAVIHRILLVTINFLLEMFKGVRGRSTLLELKTGWYRFEDLERKVIWWIICCNRLAACASPDDSLAFGGWSPQQGRGAVLPSRTQRMQSRGEFTNTSTAWICARGC